MIKLILLVVLTVAALTVTTLSGSDQAHAGPDWPGGPLLNCADLDGDGSVTVADSLIILQRFNRNYDDDPDTYSLLADLNGDRAVGFPDFLVLVRQLSNTCPLTESQVAKATLAAEKYRDPTQATADGYILSSQYVPSMGIHMVNAGNQVAFPDLDNVACNVSGGLGATCQLENPVGLLYTETSPGSTVPDQLIGVWIIVPTQEVCDLYGIQGACQPEGTQPVGFGLTNTDEDNIDPDGAGPQRGWHTHPGLCVWNWGTTSAFVNQNVPQADCLSTGGQAWFSTYGWMIHVYNFIPNPDGRFQNWSCLIPGSVVTCP